MFCIYGFIALTAPLLRFPVTQIGDTIDLVSNQLQTLQNLMAPLQEFMADPEKMALVAKEDQRTQYIKQDVKRQLRMFSEADLEDEAIHNIVRQELAEKTSQIASLADLQVRYSSFRSIFAKTKRPFHSTECTFAGTQRALSIKKIPFPSPTVYLVPMYLYKIFIHLFLYRRSKCSSVCF